MTFGGGEWILAIKNFDRPVIGRESLSCHREELKVKVVIIEDKSGNEVELPPLVATIKMVPGHVCEVVVVEPLPDDGGAVEVEDGDPMPSVLIHTLDRNGNRTAPPRGETWSVNLDEILEESSVQYNDRGGGSSTGRRGSTQHVVNSSGECRIDGLKVREGVEDSYHSMDR